MALLPAHVLFTTVLLSETYFGFLLAATLAIFVYFVLDRERARPHLALMLGLGALTVFAGYVRGEFLAYGGLLALLHGGASAARTRCCRWRRSRSAARSSSCRGRCATRCRWAS